MIIKIDLSPEEIDCLRDHLRTGSSAYNVLAKAANLFNPGPGMPMNYECFTFTSNEAGELLVIAERNCREAVYKIKEALRRSGHSV